jgi:pilus assembly protein TadC
MKKTKKPSKPRNPGLIFIASILLLIGLGLVVVVLSNVSLFGWWGLLVALSGLITAAAAIVSIVKNDPTWILLDLLLPT